MVPGVDPFDRRHPAPVVENAGELRDPRPHAVRGPLGDPQPHLRLALDRVLPAIRLLEPDAEDSRDRTAAHHRSVFLAPRPDAAVGQRPPRQGISLGDGPPSGRGIFSVGFEEPYRWKDSVQSEPEVRLWVAEGTANGIRPWVTKFSGVLHDRAGCRRSSGSTPGTSARALPAERGAARARRAAALGADRTYHAGVAPGDRAADHMLGMYHALVESRMPFELVHEAFLTPDRLDAVQAPDPRRRGGSVRCAVPRDPGVRGARRQRAGDVCFVALRRAGDGGERLRPRRPLRRVVRRPHRRADAQLLSEP